MSMALFFTVGVGALEEAPDARRLVWRFFSALLIFRVGFPWLLRLLVPDSEAPTVDGDNAAPTTVLVSAGDRLGYSVGEEATHLVVDVSYGGRQGWSPLLTWRLSRLERTVDEVRYSSAPEGRFELWSTAADGRVWVFAFTTYSTLRAHFSRLFGDVGRIELQNLVIETGLHANDVEHALQVVRSAVGTSTGVASVGYRLAHSTEPLRSVLQCMWICARVQRLRSSALTAFWSTLVVALSVGSMTQAGEQQVISSYALGTAIAMIAWRPGMISALVCLMCGSVAVVNEGFFPMSAALGLVVFVIVARISYFPARLFALFLERRSGVR